MPELVVRRRFNRSIRNFLVSYRPLADSWTLFDNSGAEPEVIAFETAGVSHIMKPGTYKSLTSLYGTK